MTCIRVRISWQELSDFLFSSIEARLNQSFSTTKDDMWTYRKNEIERG